MPLVVPFLAHLFASQVLIIVPLRALLDQFALDFPDFCKVGTGYNRDIDYNAKGFLAVTDSVRLLARLEFDAIFVDEAHHPLPKAFPKTCLLYRFSATHQDEPDFRYSMGQAMEDAVLCDYDLTVPLVTPEHGHTYLSLADLLLKQAGRFRRVLAYCNSVREAKIFLMVLRKLGMAAWHMNGRTPAKKRRDILDQFAGRLQKTVHVLVTVEVLGEGINIPNADTCMFVEPRNSYRSIVQAIGRVLRPHPTKPLAHIVLPGVALAAPSKKSDVRPAVHMGHQSSTLRESAVLRKWDDANTSNAGRPGQSAAGLYSAPATDVRHSESLLHPDCSVWEDSPNNGDRQLFHAESSGDYVSNFTERMAPRGRTLARRAPSQHKSSRHRNAEGAHTSQSRTSTVVDVSFNGAKSGMLTGQSIASLGRQSLVTGGEEGERSDAAMMNDSCCNTQGAAPRSLLEDRGDTSFVSTPRQTSSTKAPLQAGLPAARQNRRLVAKTHHPIGADVGFGSQLQRFLASLVQADHRLTGLGWAAWRRIQIVNCTSAWQTDLSMDEVTQAVFSELAAFLQNSDPWEARFKSLEHFVEKRGRLPRGGTSDFVERSLHTWLNNQGHLALTNQLRPHRLQTFLNASTPLLRTRARRWFDPGRAFRQNCRDLQAYILRHGCLPERKYSSTANSLAGWLYNQFRHGFSMPSWKLKMLEDIHPLVKAKAQSWHGKTLNVLVGRFQRRWRKISDFVARKGRLPHRYEGSDLMWLQTKRRQFRSGLLSAELLLRLQDSHPILVEYLQLPKGRKWGS